MLRTITNNFAALTVLGVGLAWFFPAGFTWMTDGRITIAGQPLLSLALGVIMLAMGLTLTFDDYRKLASAPRALVAGVVLQFAVMPLTGFAIAKGLALEPGLAVGLILVACCPGGTASNIVTFIARGNVALSVAMTMASTLAAVDSTQPVQVTSPTVRNRTEVSNTSSPAPTWPNSSPPSPKPEESSAPSVTCTASTCPPYFCFPPPPPGRGGSHANPNPRAKNPNSRPFSPSTPSVAPARCRS